MERVAQLVRFVWANPPVADDPVSDNDVANVQVCVIVAARDESAAVSACLSSLMAQDHDRTQVVAVDDRSTDGTGEIMDHIAAGTDRLTVVHVNELPDGWLGKNHANARGVASAPAGDAEYLIFTDGDVLFAPDCVRRAVAIARACDLDHLCLTPEVITHGPFERAMCYFFAFCYLLKCRAWHIDDPRAPNAFCGVGAFNLVRRTAYALAGGHDALRMEVLDDYKLGKLIKRAGGRCALRDGGRLVRVRWQNGLLGVVKGLEKNAFAGCDYSLIKLAGYTAMLVVAFLAPLLLAVATSGPTRWGWLGALVIQVGSLTWLGRHYLCGLLSPICAVAMIWALWRSAVLAYVRGGVRWRNTLYALDALRNGMF
jgi:hypothetical protein